MGSVREEWMDSALCAETDPELFFGDKSEWYLTVRAKLVCKRCPVRDACLAYALKHKVMFGVWGGLTAKQRQDIRVGRRGLAS